MAISLFQMQGKRASGRLKSWTYATRDYGGAGAGEAVSNVVVAGGGVYVPIPDDPTTLITSGGALNAWFRGDSVVQSGGFVSQWTDKMGNVLNHMIQATGPNQPAYIAVDATAQNQPTVLGDGANDYLLAAGATLGAIYWIAVVVKQIGYSTNARIFGSSGGGGRAQLIQAGGSPGLEQFETGVGGNGPNNGAPIGQWRYVEYASNNTTSDFLSVGSSPSTGVASGRTASSTAFQAFNDGGHPFNGAIAEIIVANYIPNLTERANTRTYAANRYGASVLS